jgi:hypothetical protein
MEVGAEIGENINTGDLLGRVFTVPPRLHPSIDAVQGDGRYSILLTN